MLCLLSVPESNLKQYFTGFCLNAYPKYSLHLSVSENICSSPLNKSGLRITFQQLDLSSCLKLCLSTGIMHFYERVHFNNKYRVFTNGRAILR